MVSVTDDPLSEMRKRVAELSPEELQGVLDEILGGGLARFAPEPEPHSPELPTVHEAPAEPVLLTVRVDVDGAEPPVWRRLVLRGELRLDEVHAVLQAAFGWEDYHLHRFSTGPDDQVWNGPYFLTTFDLDEGEEGLLETDVRLDQVLRSPGDRLTYTYDFGDDWTHTIRLESVDPMPAGAPRAVCTGGRMAGPLEDCGGVWTHNELVEAFRADPVALPGLDDDLRAWLPEGWDPTRIDLDEVALRLSLVGKDVEEVLAALPPERGGSGPGFPAALQPLLDLAPRPVEVELARLCVRARAEQQGELGPEDVAEIARPYRYLVELAGEDGIPLTAAGWMKPAYVQRIYHDLDLADEWIGKGNREDQTVPVLRLREMCQQAGLLRKHKGRLLRTRLARSLTTDQGYVEALAARLLRDRNEYVHAARALFALLTAASGRADHDHMSTIADLMTACGLRTGPTGVDQHAVVHWVRSVWVTLQDVTGRTFRDRDLAEHPGDQRAVALARAALWPG